MVCMHMRLDCYIFFYKLSLISWTGYTVSLWKYREQMFGESKAVVAIKIYHLIDNLFIVK